MATPSKIVEAVGAASSSRGRIYGRKVEEAMTQAIKDAHKAGITKPDEVKALMLEARAKVKRPADADDNIT